ncbi:uncharacterized protein LOC134836700 isoform X1 [Culicoides brevitarsis]|uniref:uncharacterized protein LOC134836700 isoform X1 n=1 Tax=Culicoides brevitarsis TaxID=469753 RepID=UPI00307C3E7C
METTPKSAKNPYKPALCKIENDYEKKVREEIFDTGEFADVVFLVGAEKRPFKAHRFVLITSSLKFKQMMDLHKDLEKPIIIEEVEPQIFEQLLQVIYLHRLELYSFENAMICSKVFEDFGLAAAVKECQAYLKQPIEITTENAITLFEMNREVPERAETVEECIKLFCFQTHEILKSVGFSRAHASTLAFIFDLPHLTIDSELDLVNALCQFAEMHGALPAHNEDGREDHFKELVRPALEKVHFLALTPKEVVKSAAIRALLSDAEVAGLLATLICPENELYKLPEGFSTATNDRGFAKCPRFADASHETTLPGFANTAEIDSQLTEKTAQGSVDWTPSKIMAQGDDETSGAGTLETGNPIGLNSTQDSSVFAAENETLASDNFECWKIPSLIKVRSRDYLQRKSKSVAEFNIVGTKFCKLRHKKRKQEEKNLPLKKRSRLPSEKSTSNPLDFNEESLLVVDEPPELEEMQEISPSTPSMNMTDDDLLKYLVTFRLQNAIAWAEKKPFTL